MDNLPKLNKERIGELKKKLFLSPLAKALLEYMDAPYYPGEGRAHFIAEIELAAGKRIEKMATVDDFYCKALRKAVESLTDEKFADDVRDLLEIAARGQFSSTIFRRTYGSSFFGFYRDKVLPVLRGFIFFYFYEKSVPELLKMKHDGVDSISYLISLEINRGNQEVIDIVKDMMLGDNNVLLSSSAVKGIICSDNQELKSILKDLLIAAKGQEGLRQSILENADAGDIETFKLLLKACVENDLFRFSSAARALYTWTGIYTEDIDIKFSRKMGTVAWECLTDTDKRKEYYESDNPFEIYLSLWAEGCKEIQNTEAVVTPLLNSKKAHRKLLGWYFVLRVENAEYKHKMALKHIDNPELDDLRVFGLATDCLYVKRGVTYAFVNRDSKYEAKPSPDPIYPLTRHERRKLFDKLVPLVEFIGKGKWDFPGYLFPWTDMKVSNERANVIPCMLSLAAYDLDDYMIEKLHGLMEYMDVDRRSAFYAHLLQPEKNSLHKEYILEGIRDKSPSTKEICIEKLMKCRTEERDIDAIVNMFSTKSGDLRKVLVKYLTALSTSDKLMAINKLAAGSDNHIQAACELVLKDSSVEKGKDVIKKAVEGKTVLDQTKLLLDQLFPEENSSTDDITPENGYGLFDHTVVEKTLKEFDSLPYGSLSEKDILSMALKDNEIEKIFDALNSVVERNRDYEYAYINYADERITAVLGNSIYMKAEFGKHGEMYQTHSIKLDMMPCGDQFKEALKDIMGDRKKLMILRYMNMLKKYLYSGTDYDNWVIPFLDRYEFKYSEKIRKKYGPRFEQLKVLIDIAFFESSDCEMERLILDMYLSLIRLFGTDRLNDTAIHYKYGSGRDKAAVIEVFTALREMLAFFEMGDEDFREYFRKEYVIERSIGFTWGSVLRFADFVRAIDLGIITPDHLFDWILYPERNRIKGNLEILTTPGKTYFKEWCEKYPWFKELPEKAVRNLVLFESKRGQADTPVSPLIREIGRVNGTEYFVLLLKALGTEGFHHGYVWLLSTKQQNLSILLKRCYPKEDETADTLKSLLKDTGIKETRLIEAAMYAPQWAPFIEEITGWKGLKKAVWFFHAHVSEMFSSEKETEVALYSPIAPKDFNDGLFDADWFRESYEEMGEKRFSTLHKYAKYITSGSNAHKRSQLFADAARGKIDVSALEEEINDKRNQERLRAYAIVPLKEGTTAELLKRYEFIAKYMKESKQFGAQRRESERKAGDAALRNLAVTCGLFDVNRMLWKLEKAKNEEIIPLLKKKEVEGYELSISIDDEGNSSVACAKGGKELKSIPKALSKNEYAELLKEKVKELKDQKIRGKETLENAMIKGTLFGADEIADLLSSIVISPMAKKLVWTDGVNLGFPDMEDGRFVLKSCDGTVTCIADDAKIKVAHPYHFATAKVWSSYMHMLYENSIIQPFKQVFREYYPITEEEKDENTVSRRYAGYQVQLSRTAALLKSRGWTVDYDCGWQKVN
ncbi:MAG: DUF4132 domain-containing protein, partial [Clostridia bacterium]|nr:DUF4132 domain-containing protein [Clostridia bacterium]